MNHQNGIFLRDLLVAAGVLLIAGLFPATVQADPLQPEQEPMMTSTKVDPNVYWALDDSGSMNYEYTIRQHYRSCVYGNFSTSSSSSTCSESVQTNADEPGYNNGSTVSPGNSTNGDNRNAVSTGSTYANNSTGRSSMRQVAGYESTQYWQEWRLRSSDFNVTFFNPDMDYQPWADPDPDVDLYQDADFRSARSNGNGGGTMNLTCYNAWHTSTNSTTNCGGLRNGLTLDHYSGPANSLSSTARTNQALNGFVFERWVDSHGYNGDRPKRRRAENNADGGRNNTPNGEIEYWDDHVRYHVRYCGSSNGPSGRWIGNAGGGLPLTSIPTNNSPWCPASGYVVEWFYLQHPAIGSGSNTQYNLPRIRARGVFAGEQLDNAVDAEGNPVGSGLNANQIAQRAANWYTYYRSRLHLLKSAVGSAVRANPGMRYGMRFMNNNTGITTTVPNLGISDYVNHNRTMLQGLYAKSATGGTPLSAVMENSANYLRNTAPMPYTCQHNFLIAFTDGYNTDSASTTVGNADGDNWSRSPADIARYFYMNDLRPGLANNVASSRHPNRDAHGKTHQYLTTFPVSLGLRGFLRDTDGNGWPDRDWNDNPFTPTVGGNWVSGVPSAQTDQRRLDNLWKAAFNSDGKYIAATDARALVDGINATLRHILERTASSSAAAASAGQLTAGLLAFQPNYDAGKWIGRVRAFRFDAASREFDEVMEYGARLNAQSLASRQIITINSASRNGVPFSRSHFSTEQFRRLIGAGGTGGDIYNAVDAPYNIYTADTTQIAENNAYGDDLINWLRGNDNVVSSSPSGMSRTFRNRDGWRLGDIVNSSPAFVGDSFRYYPHNLETSSYNVFRQTNMNRSPMLYVGANDGMLHGFKVGDTAGAGNIVFNSDAGQEKLAYIPNAVFHKLAHLSNPDYTHRYFVDAPISVVEAYSTQFPGAGGNWRSVLVAGMGGGGQGVFALDVTNPNNFSEANAGNVVLWEFGDRATSPTAADGDADIGHVYGVVEVVKLANGKWAAIFGNGYGATEPDGSAGSSSAKLFIVDIATGALIRKIDTNAPGTSFDNGLSQPLAVDVDGNYVTDYVYAGDMEGDLWKFDLRSSSPASWSVSKVFDGVPGQPIFAKPTAVQHPRGGLMVLFGTGRYMIQTDNVNASYPVQRFYGIWDKPGAGAVTGVGNLAQQTVTTETRTQGMGSVQVRITSDNPVDYNSQRGWYMNFTGGERIVANPDVILGFGGVAVNPLVRFHTYIPSQDPCVPSGESWTMMLDALSGGRPMSAVYDFNGDGRFDDLDMDYLGEGNDGISASGIKNNNGMIGLSGDNLLDDGTSNSSTSICAGLAAGSDTGETVDISTSLMCNQRQGRGAWRQLVQ